ncbi:MAG: ATP-binding protein [Chloroflexota bacterium]
MRPGFSQRRSNELALVWAVAVVLVALLSLSTLASPPVLGVHSTPLENGAQRLTWIMPGGYGYEAGLRPGDVVRLVPPPPSSGAWGAVEVIEGTQAGQLLPLTRRWPGITNVVLFILGLEFLLAGLVVFLRASDRPAANYFAVLAAACAAIFVSFPAVSNGHPWALALEWFGSKIGMAFFALFFLSTPVRRWKPLYPFLLGLPVPVLAFYCYTVLGHPDLYSVAKPTGYSYMAFGLTVSLATMVLPFLTHAPREQRRLWPVLLSSGLATALYLAGTLPYLLLRRYLIPAEVAIMGLTLLPLGFVWAMLRYPFMGISLGPWAVVKTVFDTISDPIFVVGRNGELIDASRSGLAMLGLARVRDARELFGQLVARVLVTDRDIPSPNGALVQRVLAGEVVRDEERALRCPQGETLHVSIAGTPLYNERGEVDMAVLICHDITERKRREEERLELDRQKDEFLASVSHDLKTPLTAIKSSVGVVLANEPPGTPEALHRMLANIDLSADKMAAMVEDLLEMARLQSGRVQLRLDRCDLRELALRSAAAIEPLASSRNQRLELDLPPGSVPAVVDGRRLERALANLLSNAYQYGHPGGKIRLNLRQRAGEALFAVTDDGPGIPEEEQQRIFERFYRLDRGHDGTAMGSGLGLPIARAMVELHGGRAWVESELGAGSTFWIAVPTHHPEDGTRPATPAPEGEARISSEASAMGAREELTA